MPIVIPDGYSQVILKTEMPHAGGARQAITTFGVQAEPDLSIIEDIKQNWIDNIWSPLGSTHATFQGVTMLTDTIGFESGANAAGTHSGDMPPPNTTLLVRKITGSRGRANQGRMFPPGLVYENTYDNAGMMSPESQDDYNEAFETFSAQLATDGAAMVILHQDDTLPTVVLSLFVEATAATQRRRLR